MRYIELLAKQIEEGKALRQTLDDGPVFDAILDHEGVLLERMADTLGNSFQDIAIKVETLLGTTFGESEFSDDPSAGERALLFSILDDIKFNAMLRADA